MRERLKFFLFLSILISGLLTSSLLQAQTPDSSKVVIGLDGGGDSLDIAQNRGVFIVTPDGKMQLRILGSVRYLAVFDDLDLQTKNSLITYEIPTGDDHQILPNYYNGLTQLQPWNELPRHPS